MKVGKKNTKKNRFFPVTTDFFCDFFCPLSWENSKDLSLASNLRKIAKKLEKTGPEDNTNFRPLDDIKFGAVLSHQNPAEMSVLTAGVLVNPFEWLW